MRAALKATEARTTMSDIRSGKFKFIMSRRMTLTQDYADGVSLNSVATYIPEGEDIVPGLVFKTPRKPTKMQALNEYIGILSASDNPTPAGRISSFMSSSGSGSSKVFIEFEIICQRLRRRVLEAVARERYGDEAVRIIRLLLQHGKMSVDQVSEVAVYLAPVLTALEGGKICYDGYYNSSNATVTAIGRFLDQYPGSAQGCRPQSSAHDLPLVCEKCISVNLPSLIRAQVCGFAEGVLSVAWSFL